jgi:hypothetical protein
VICLFFVFLTQKRKTSDISAAAGLKSGQSNRERNFEKANIEYRIMNVEGMNSVYLKKD